MTWYVWHLRKGAVRGEYIIAAAICTLLILGMVAVLFVQGTRMGAPKVRVATPQNRPDTPTPSPSPTPVQQQPNPTNNPPKNAQPNNDAPVIIVTEEPNKNPAPEVIVVAPGGAPGKSTAYPNGDPKVISATDKTRVEAKDYDKGGEGVAYHDMSAANEGHAYRPDEGVDLEKSNDSEGDVNIGFIQSGEWVNYTIRVAQSGEYKLRLRVARQDAGDAKVRLLFDGSDKTGEIAIPSTGGYQQYRTVDAGQVELAAGEQVMRVDMVVGGFNLEWIELVPASAANQTETVKIEVPGGDQKAPEVVVIPANGAANALQQDVFSDLKVGARPNADGWSYSIAGTINVQEDIKTKDHYLRVVDTSTKQDAWVRRTFPAQNQKVTVTLRIRFSPGCEGAWISLLEKDKQGVFLGIQNGQFGYVKDDTKWYPLTRLEATAWTNVRIEANVKDHKFSLFINDKQVGDPQMNFRNYVGQLDGWSCGTSVPQTGTVYIQSVAVSD